MQFGFGRLRLSSSAFWTLTPRELAQAIMALHPPGAAPLRQDDLYELLARFPDTPAS